MYHRVGRRAQDVVNKTLLNVNMHLNPKHGQENLPKSNSHSPNSLGLEAVGSSNTSPMAKTKARSRLVQVLRSGCNKSISSGGICVLGRCVNDVAVKERQRLSQSDCADNKGNEKQSVESSHDKKAKIGP